MAVDRRVVERVAQLSKLELAKDEKRTLAHQLTQILNYFKQLQHINTDGVPPTTHVLPKENVFREDVVEDSLSQDEALRNAPQKKSGCFAVPRVLR